MLYRVKTLVPNVSLPDGRVYRDANSVVTLTEAQFMKVQTAAYVGRYLEFVNTIAESGDAVEESAWISGTAWPPSNAEGKNGNYYFNTDAAKLLGPKKAGRWPEVSTAMDLAGAQGVPGPAGPAGPQGPAGPAGSQGAQGERGERGLTGLTGPAGPQGPQGEAGSLGPAGEVGPQGPQGMAGAPGARGEAGPQGVQGVQGDAGPQGAAGPRGEVGPVGPQGIQGIKGDTGLSGPQGLKGDTGAAGPQGPKGDTGATGATGPQGPQGLQGATGATGPQGAAGTSGLVATRRKSSTTGSVTISLATWVDLFTSTMDITLPAAVGDILELNASFYVAPNTLGQVVQFGAVSVVGATLTSLVPATGGVIAGWTSSIAGGGAGGPNLTRPLVAGDLSNGNVTVRLQSKMGVLGLVRVISADAANPFTWWVVNKTNTVS